MRMGSRVGEGVCRCWRYSVGWGIGGREGRGWEWVRMVGRDYKVRRFSYLGMNILLEKAILGNTTLSIFFVKP